VGAGFGVSRATAYRYRDEVVTVLAEQAPDLHDALTDAAARGWSHVVLDGKVFRTDRCAETTTSTKGETINTCYSGIHHAPGGNVQAIMRPDGLPVWISDVIPGHQHVPSVCSAPCTARRPSSTYPRSPIPATTAPVRASTPRSSSPAAGERCDVSPPAHAESATTSRPHSS
jgi:hypothetical protein